MMRYSKMGKCRQVATQWRLQHMQIKASRANLAQRMFPTRTSENCSFPMMFEWRPVREQAMKTNLT